MTDADDAGLLGAGSVSGDVTDPTDIAVLACEVERAKLEAEVERLRGQVTALREALEYMLEATAPDSTMREVFAAQDRAVTVLAESPTSG